MMSFTTIGENPCKSSVMRATITTYPPILSQPRNKEEMLLFKLRLLKGKEKVIKMIVIIAKEKNIFPEKHDENFIKVIILYYILTDAVR